MGQRRGHRQTAAISGQKTRGKRWKGENCIGQAQAQAHVCTFRIDVHPFFPSPLPVLGLTCVGVSLRACIVLLEWLDEAG